MKYIVNEYIQCLKEHNIYVRDNITSDGALNKIDGIEFNSQLTVPNSIFIMKGVNFKLSYLEAAIKSGAIVVIRDEKFHLAKEAVPKLVGMEIVVSNINKAMAVMANKYNDNPWEKLNLIGVTGTKGKSTTVMYVKNILDTYANKNIYFERNHNNFDTIKLPNPGKTGISSGVTIYYGENEEEPSHLTTPESITLQNYLKKSVENRLQNFVMEVSSHALKYDRVANVIYKIGAYLNIGEDHISEIEHSDFNDYFESKKQLFNQSEYMCINMDDENYKEVLHTAMNSPINKGILTFGLHKDAAIRASNIKTTDNGICFHLTTPTYQEEIVLNMKGIFNVTNALCSICIAYFLDVPIGAIKEGLQNASVPGRMETFKSTDGQKTVIVDYAHNEMSYNALFDSVSVEYPNRKIYILFGISGGRSLSRRKLLGTITGKRAELTYVTEADYGQEPLEKIMRETAEHIAKAGGVYELIPVRGEAIKKAMDILDKDSILIVAGKGREKSQTVGTKEIPITSDVEYVNMYIEEYNNI